MLPKRLGPKRATKIRRFFNLEKKDDVRKFVIRREVTSKTEGAKPYTKACVSFSVVVLQCRGSALTCARSPAAPKSSAL